MIVKFCRFPDGVKGDEEVKRRLRFKREVDALRKASDAGLGEFLITFYEADEYEIDKRRFLYYVMEEADYDLSDYLAKSRPTLQQKVLLCRGILEALRMLHDKLNIYHRDLKPDNIFFTDGQWKIGDLGFICHRIEDKAIDGPRERIGPTGLMSPEATNKAFANLENSEFSHDSKIDDLSDIYELGGVFWYILQGNFPTGQIVLDDFLVGDADIFSRVLMPMLQHGKLRRPSPRVLQAAFADLAPKYAM